MARWRVTDRQTDGQTDGFAVANTALAMRALRRAVKTSFAYPDAGKNTGFDSLPL